MVFVGPALRQEGALDRAFRYYHIRRWCLPSSNMLLNVHNHREPQPQPPLQLQPRSHLHPHHHPFVRPRYPD